MTLHNIQRVNIRVWQLKRFGFWEDAQKRFKLPPDMNDFAVVTLLKGTTLKTNLRSAPRTATRPECKARSEALCFKPEPGAIPGRAH